MLLMYLRIVETALVPGELIARSFDSIEFRLVRRLHPYWDDRDPDLLGGTDTMVARIDGQGASVVVCVQRLADIGVLPQTVVCVADLSLLWVSRPPRGVEVAFAPPLSHAVVHSGDRGGDLPHLTVRISFRRRLSDGWINIERRSRRSHETRFCHRLSLFIAELSFTAGYEQSKIV